MMRAYHRSQGRSPKKVFIPDSAHGTNPASCALNGFQTVAFETVDGRVDPEILRAALEKAGDDVAGARGELRVRHGQRGKAQVRGVVARGDGQEAVHGAVLDATCNMRDKNV